MNRSQSVNRPKTFSVIVATLLVSLCVTARLSYGGNRVEVRVPRIVREDLVRRAVDFCRIAYPDVPRKIIRESLASNLKKEKWEILMGTISGTYGCRAILSIGENTNDHFLISFPAGMPERALNANRKRPFPGAKKGELSKQKATEMAEAILKRLIPAREKREAYKADGYGQYVFSWEKRIGKGCRTLKYIRIGIDDAQGYVQAFSFTNRTIPDLDRPIISREEIKKEIARVYGMEEVGPVKVRGGGKQIISPSDQVRDDCLKLKVGYSMGRHLLWWEYKKEKGGMASADRSVFDAVSGQLIYSNVRNDRGEKVEDYINRGYYPWDTKEKIIQRLEYLARRRAVELRHRRRQKEKGKQEKQEKEDAAPEKEPGEEGE